MKQQNTIVETLCNLKNAAPMGYALGLHIRYTTPTFMLETYAQDWKSHYAENGLLLSDPTVIWGFENDGWRSWEDLKGLDTAGVLNAASGFGINFGITCAAGFEDMRTIGSFSRADRNFTPDEADAILAEVQTLNDLTSGLVPFTAVMRQELMQNGIEISQNSPQDPLDSANVPA